VDAVVSVIPVGAQPPVGCWTPLPDRSGGAGYLSVYLSEPLARYPVRHIAKPADNKSDPNIETGTYGLFSTCERVMRAKIVREGRRWIFFVTTHRDGGRKLTGYYEVGWYAEGVGGAVKDDYALAAVSVRFIQPVPLGSLPAPARRICQPFFRTIRPIDPSTKDILCDCIDDRADLTDAYLAEIRRMERFARHHTGFAYPSWGRVDGFSWTDADRYLQPVGKTVSLPAAPRTHKWQCTACQYNIVSKALLKSCPICNEMWTLTPKPEEGSLE